MEKLRAWLADNGITQSSFAKDLKVSQPTVSDWLTGETTPSTSNLRAIAARTGLSLDDLLAAPTSSPSTPNHAAA